MYAVAFCMILSFSACSSDDEPEQGLSGDEIVQAIKSQVMATDKDGNTVIASRSWKSLPASMPPLPPRQMKPAKCAKN